MNIPSNLLYTKDHEWARLEGDTAVIGISEYAQGELGDVVFVELPPVGDQVTKGAAFGTIEAVKAVSDLFAPFSGEVIEINGDLENAPETINTSPYENGWMIKIRVSDISEKADLMGPEQYKALVGEA
jgi:glycine cleavage system H protein